MIWRNSVYYIIYLKLASSIFDEIRRIKLFTRNSWRSSSYLWTIENDQFGQSMAFVNDNLLSLVYSSTSLVLQFVYFVIISLKKGIKIYFALLIYPSFPFLLFRFICSIESWQKEIDAAFYFVSASLSVPNWNSISARFSSRFALCRWPRSIALILH